MKIWKSDKKGDDKIIAYGNNTIYKANPPVAGIGEYSAALETNDISAAFFSIPLSYIRYVRLQEGKKYIEVFFGKDSCEHLRVADDVKRNEIFDHFKQSIPGKYATGKYSTLQAGKKPLIAMGVVALLFSLCLYYAVNIEQGTEYTVPNRVGITGVVLAIATLGVTKVVLLFSSLLAIAIASFIIKTKNRPVVRQLVVNS